MKTLAQQQKHEGLFLVYDRAMRRLSFSATARDNKRHFLVGRVTKGLVADKPVDYWLCKIAERKGRRSPDGKGEGA